MYIDGELLFADGTWNPTATGDNITPNTHDTSPLGNLLNTNAGRDLGMGEELIMRFLVTQTVTSGGAATVDFRVVTDSVAAISSPVVMTSSGAIAKASLTAGTKISLKLPREGAQGSWKKYIGGNANIGTAVLTAGKFHVAVVLNEQDSKTLQPGFSVK